MEEEEVIRDMKSRARTDIDVGRRLTSTSRFSVTGLRTVPRMSVMAKRAPMDSAGGG